MMSLQNGENYNLMTQQLHRIIVKLMKVTTPTREKITRTVLEYKENFQIYSVSSSVINDILPKVDSEYQKLLEKTRRNKLESLKNFYK